ncbi:hypothetical protein MA16_Dca019672 [Dendrobium catenatum]|uniref:Uncharacterized protein n=1 Tax=Dendrobium catenatum TaxID=906689 RepID=A0A2I0X179_9ASPA|nr:hypothetical protein MA16_Dca019672 [Dendrobium catenatum]
MFEPFDEANKLIEEMATNNFQWPADRLNPKKVVEIYKYDALIILTLQVVTISKKLNNLKIKNRIS